MRLILNEDDLKQAAAEYARQKMALPTGTRLAARLFIFSGEFEAEIEVLDTPHEDE